MTIGGDPGASEDVRGTWYSDEGLEWESKGEGPAKLSEEGKGVSYAGGKHRSFSPHWKPV